MKGKTVVVTGGTSGIGRAAAQTLAGMGARIVLVARDPGRAEATMKALRRVNPGVSHALHLADLARLDEVKRVGAAIAAAEPRVDVLVNNAGAWFPTRQETDDGFEKTFALNHLAYVVLTDALMPGLTAAAPSRVVSTSSVAHRFGALDLDDLQSRRGYEGFKAYCRSKLCNVLFTRELARRLAGTGVTANCFHPGFVASRFGDETGGLTRFGFGVAKSLFAISPDKGAATLVYLATAPEMVERSGGYYAKSKPAGVSRAGRDAGAARRLWDETARMVDVGHAGSATMGR